MIAGSFGGTVYALDAATGQRRWSHHTQKPINGTVATDSKRVYVPIADPHKPKVMALSLKTGRKLWSQADLDPEGFRRLRQPRGVEGHGLHRRVRALRRAQRPGGQRAGAGRGPRREEGQDQVEHLSRRPRATTGRRSGPRPRSTPRPSASTSAPATPTTRPRPTRPTRYSRWAPAGARSSPSTRRLRATSGTARAMPPPDRTTTSEPHRSCSSARAGRGWWAPARSPACTGRSTGAA